MVYNEVWTWEGRTNNGSFQWRTRDGILEYGEPWTQALEDDCLAKTRATYEASILAEFIQAAASQGATVVILQVAVTAEMVKSTGQVSCRWGSGGLHEFCDHTLPFYMHIKGVVSFTCDKPWTGDSLTALALFILIKVVPILLIAIGVSWGIYNFLTHLAFTQSTSTVTETWTDPDGTTHTKTETKTQQGPDYIALMIIGGLIIVGVLVVPELLRQRRGTVGRSTRKRRR